MKSIITSLGIFILSLNAFAQNEVYLTITHKLGSELFAFNQAVQNNLGNNFNVTRIDYYISSVKIIHDGGLETEVEGLHLLVKGQNNPVFLLGEFDVTNVESIQFSIGVHPSLNNADPALQPSGSALSFQQPSMHWGWSSGYRFVALEGKSGASLVTTYEFHSLWNANYFAQTIDVNAVANSENKVYIHLDADYIEAVRDIELLSGPLNHGSDLGDLTVLENFRDHVFSAGNGAALTIENMELINDFQIYPNPVDDILHVMLNPSANFMHAETLRFEICDMTGRVIETGVVSNITNITLNLVPAGIYLIRVLNKDEVVFTDRIVKQ